MFLLRHVSAAETVLLLLTIFGTISWKIALSIAIAIVVKKAIAIAFTILLANSGLLELAI